MHQTTFAQLLVCTDGSESALRATRSALGIARKFGSEVTILSVIPAIEPMTASTPVHPYGAGMESVVTYNEIHKSEERHCQQSLVKAAAVFANSGVPYQTRSENGHVVDVISNVAKEIHADLIVVGSRGLGGFDRLLLGSISDGVAHHAHCSVLVAREESAK
jgi:nucleotide-binding universal stress UspA family protein